MTSEADPREKFWHAIKSDRTIMLGLVGADEAHCQPMTAQLDGDKEAGPIYIFTSKHTDLVKALGQGHEAAIQFSSKGHDLFASVQGHLYPDYNRATIDRLWNAFVAAWFEGGKDDPKLQLIRFEPEHGQIWLNEHSLFAGVKMLLGSDPKQDYKDKVADVDLH